jgi:hypothetical protein
LLEFVASIACLQKLKKKYGEKIWVAPLQKQGPVSDRNGPDVRHAGSSSLASYWNTTYSTQPVSTLINPQKTLVENCAGNENIESLLFQDKWDKFVCMYSIKMTLSACQTSLGSVPVKTTMACVKRDCDQTTKTD